MVKTGLVKAIDSLVSLDELFATFQVWGILETDIQEKNKKKAKSKQFQARSRKGQSQKSDKARKYNFGGPKLPKPQVVLQKRKTRVKIAKKMNKLQSPRIRLINRAFVSHVEAWRSLAF
ncbi:hypothetical protein Tco_0277948 [Tanacetum coccineum]